MVDEFNLTRENAKEYFFLNQCREMYIDLGDTRNADKFRSYGFDDATLIGWTNEWLNLKLDNTDFKSDKFGFSSLIGDLGYRTDGENAKKLIAIYKDIKCELSDKDKIAILFRHDFFETLNKHYYHGLIYIAAKNKMQESLSPLLAELNLLLQDYPQETKKQYDKYLKKVFKEYGVKI